VLSRLPLLEELSIEMDQACGWSRRCFRFGDGPRLRITSQSLRLLDVRGMGKSCEVSYLACPALEEVRTLSRGCYDGGILPLVREDNGFSVIDTHGGHPGTFCAFGARGATLFSSDSSSVDEYSDCLPVDLPERCRVMIYPDGCEDNSPAEFCQRVNDDGSRSWQVQAVGALPFDFE